MYIYIYIYMYRKRDMYRSLSLSLSCMGMERPETPSRPEKISGSIAPSISGRET